MDMTWLLIGIIFLGFIFIIAALFKQKDHSYIDEKMETILDEFIEQINLENEQILNKIKQSQQDYLHMVNEKISRLEARIEKMEADQETPVINMKYKEVLRLAQNGHSIDEIAKKTQIGHGEIEFILGLFKKGFKYV